MYKFGIGKSVYQASPSHTISHPSVYQASPSHTISYQGSIQGGGGGGIPAPPPPTPPEIFQRLLYDTVPVVFKLWKPGVPSPHQM